MRNRSPHRWASVALLAVGVLGAGAWYQGQTAEPIPNPTIRVSTHLVLVDVVVTDKSGKPMTGLKPDDFTVEENGKKQKIAFFTTPEEARRQSEPPQLGPGIYTNRPEFRSPGGPAVAIVLDAANTPFQDQAYARLQMLKYAATQIKPGQQIGIFTLTGSLGVLQDFTTDPDILLLALKKFKPQDQAFQNAVPAALSGGSEALRPAAQTMIEQAEGVLADFQSVQLGYDLDRRTEVTLQGMRSLTRILGGIPGRKEIIWLTAAFPFELVPRNQNVSEAELLADLPTIDIRQKNVDTRSAGALAATQRTSYDREISEVQAQMASSQIAIYPVDVRGLASGMEFQREDAANRQSASIAGRAMARMSDVTASQETMRSIAAETGGKAYVNQNEIGLGVISALADNAASYTLAYYPSEKKWDGKYRTIKVKLGREGVEARYRHGYFAIDPSQEKDRKPEQSVAQALQDVVPNTQVTFSAQIKRADTGKIGVDFLVDPKTVSAEDSSGGKKLNLMIYAAVFAPDGKMVATRSIKIDQSFKPDVYAQIMQRGILTHLDLDPEPAKYALRLAVLDARTGMIGTLDAITP